MRMRDSMTTFVILKVPKTWWIREPLSPSKVTLKEPIAAVAFVEIVIKALAFPPWAKNRVAGEVENDTPGGTDGMIPSPIETPPVNPPMLVTVILNEPVEPCASVRVVGLIVMAKSGPPGEDTVRTRVAVWVRLPLVPVTRML